MLRNRRIAEVTGRVRLMIVCARARGWRGTEKFRFFFLLCWEGSFGAV